MRNPATILPSSLFPPVAVALLGVVAVLGCSDEESASPAEAAMTGGRQLIRVDLNQYNPGTVPQGIGEPVQVARELAESWEEQNPGWRIKYQIQVNTGSTEGEWLQTQLIGGVAPEVISQNAEAAWPHVKKGWFVPLDKYLQQPNPYVPGNERWLDLFENQAMLWAKRAPDGKLYTIPIDVVETGLFYNKDLLREHGIERPPKTWDEMTSVLATLKDGGALPMTADGNLAANWGMDIIFEMLYHDLMPQLDLLASSDDAKGYMPHYLDPHEAGFLFTKGFFTPRDPRWRELAEILKDWRRYWPKELKNSDPVRLFLTERLAMYWSGSWFIRRVSIDPYVDFDWGITYIPTITQETSRFASGTPATVIGGAAVQLHITNSALINDNVEKCVDYLMYITAPQNIERLAAEAMVYIPNIKGAEMDPRLEPFNDIFQRPYCAIKWLESFDGYYKQYWIRMLDYYLQDGIGRDEYLARVEENFQAWIDSHLEEDANWREQFEKMEAVWAERRDLLLPELDADA